MTPREHAGQVVSITAGNTRTTSNTTITRGAVAVVAALLLGGGGMVGGAALSRPAAQVEALDASVEECKRQLRQLEEDRVRAASERAALLEGIRQLDGRVGRVQALLERHVERADARGR